MVLISSLISKNPASLMVHSTVQMPTTLATTDTMDVVANDTSYVIYGVWAPTNAGSDNVSGNFTAVGAFNATNAKDALLLYSNNTDEDGLEGSTSNIVLNDLTAALDNDNFV